MVDHLAAALVGHGVRPGDRIAVLHPKSHWSFVAVHASMRAGAVWVPLDPMGPIEGIDAVLEACRPTAIIGAEQTIRARASRWLERRDPLVVATGDDLQALEAVVTNPVLSVEHIAHATDDADVDDTTLPDLTPSDPAYIIFTSGSTGEPKGILHTHRSGLAYVENAVATHDLRPDDRIAGTCPLHFDMSTLELYAAPAAGSSIVVVTEAELRFPVSLSKRLETTASTIIYAVPYQLRQLCQRGALDQHDVSAVRQVGFGGEQFAASALDEVMTAFPTAEFLNVYGPAEVNGVVSHRFPPGAPVVDGVPIGHAWDGIDLRIVDEELVDVSPGDDGELLVASPSQMTGYWERPELNERIFVEADGRRWYRTGDIVCAGPDGLMWFRGRADTRIKVRGVRLELETIESVLSDAPGVDSAVVGVEDVEGVQRVISWILPNRDDLDAGGASRVDPNELRRWCAMRLPDSAVPGDVRFVASFPSTRSGKIDRRAVRAELDAAQLTDVDRP